MSIFFERMKGAAKLDVRTYEEVEADTGSMGQAMGVVVLSSLAAGIGSISTIGAGGILVGLLAALVGWFIWAFLTYLIGAKLLPEPQTRADMGQMLRTIGFSSTPGIIRVFGIIPGLQGIIFFIAGVWMLAAMIIAVRQALDYTSTLRAIGVTVGGWLIQVLLLAFVYALFGAPTAPSPGGPA